jgi:hypothetical protein
MAATVNTPLMIGTNLETLEIDGTAEGVIGFFQPDRSLQFEGFLIRSSAQC